VQVEIRYKDSHEPNCIILKDVMNIFIDKDSGTKFIIRQKDQIVVEKLADIRWFSIRSQLIGD
jgi:hypothetical protein